MLSGQFRRIYHYHLKKCGGSTLNRWLDTLTSDDRLFDPSWGWAWLLGDWQTDINIPPVAGDTVIPRSLFHWTDVVHSHAPMRPFVLPDTFCFTVLRDPVQRVVSQITDWRRLSYEDTFKETTPVREMIADANRLCIREYLERYWQTEGRMQFDNYMTRSLAAGRIGREMLHATSAESLLDIALASLEQDYHLIGLTEDFHVGRNALCALIGLPPARAIDTLNVSNRSPGLEEEIADAAGILDVVSSVDRVLYDRARALFDDRYRALGEHYDTEAFERHHASRLLSNLRGDHRDGATCYSVRAPLTGAGFHGRDDAGKPTCAVWTGPETVTTLYIPTPPGMQISLLVWIRGYVADRQREQLRVRVDGRPAVHHLTPVDGYADLLTVDTCSARDFVRLEIEIDQTLDSADVGCDAFDERKRGLSFDSYGWRALRPIHLPRPGHF